MQNSACNAVPEWAGGQQPTKKLGSDAFADQRTLIQQDAEVTIFDIGANVGDTVEKYRTLFGKALIYAFEPSAETCMQLKQRFQGEERIKPVRAAERP